jgi:ribosomal protein S17
MLRKFSNEESLKNSFQKSRKLEVSCRAVYCYLPMAKTYREYQRGYKKREIHDLKNDVKRLAKIDIQETRKTPRSQEEIESEIGTRESS